MLIYNTTYQVEEAIHELFLIWLKESYVPAVEQFGILREPRLCRILSHQHEGYCYSLQWEVDDSKQLHHWHSKQGVKFNDEMLQLFKNKVVGFPTLMEVVE